MSTPITRIIWNSLPYSLHSRYQRVSLEKCCMLVITVFSQWPGTTDLPEPFLGHLIPGNTNAQQSQSLYFIYTLPRAAIPPISECMGMHLRREWTLTAKTAQSVRDVVCCCLSYNKACFWGNPLLFNSPHIKTILLQLPLHHVINLSAADG